LGLEGCDKMILTGLLLMILILPRTRNELLLPRWRFEATHVRAQNCSRPERVV
jgi:hypothetical protein